MTPGDLRLLTVPGLLLVVACASGPETSSLTPNHPASPHATEAPASPVADTLDLTAFATTAEKAASPAPAPSAHDGHGASATPASEPNAPPVKAVTYMCPMHPEVTSPTPGTCPKCGMKLVPKKSGAVK